jgi:hypothetical protein
MAVGKPPFLEDQSASADVNCDYWIQCPEKAWRVESPNCQLRPLGGIFRELRPALSVEEGAERLVGRWRTSFL